MESVVRCGQRSQNWIGCDTLAQLLHILIIIGERCFTVYPWAVVPRGLEAFTGFGFVNKWSKEDTLKLARPNSGHLKVNNLHFRKSDKQTL